MGVKRDAVMSGRCFGFLGPDPGHGLRVRASRGEPVLQNYYRFSEVPTITQK